MTFQRCTGTLIFRITTMIFLEHAVYMILNYIYHTVFFPCRRMPLFLVNVSPLLQHRYPSGVRCPVAQSVQGETALFPHLTPEPASAAELRDADSTHGRRRHRHHNTWEQLTKGCRTSPQEQGPLPQKESEKNKTGEKTGRMLTVDGLSMIANDVIFLTLPLRTKESNKNFHGNSR